MEDSERDGGIKRNRTGERESWEREREEKRLRMIGGEREKEGSSKWKRKTPIYMSTS